MKTNLPCQALAFILVLALLLPACGSKTAATTMHLRQTAGTVGVSDDAGTALEPAENLGLYSGYGVDTQSESYAWVDLDDVKLTKLDENSEIEITKDGKKLDIEVKSGALFFNVTEPLADDETLNIRASTMMVGIRGTCGWVEVPDPEHMTLYLLEGTVEVTAGENTETVNAGELAELSTDGEITVTAFASAAIPEFVRVELEEDDDLTGAILEDTGIDVLNPVDPVEDSARRAALLEVLNNNGGASYAGLFDMDGDGKEDLLLLRKIAEYSSYRWTAYLWDGSGVQPVDLAYTFQSTYDTYTTDDIYTVTAGVYRQRDTGVLYVRYYGEYVGGAYSNYYVSTADTEYIPAPFWGGGFDGTEEEYELWRQEKEQEQQAYEADLMERFETLEELDVGGFGTAQDYTYTLDTVRQQLTAG